MIQKQPALKLVCAVTVTVGLGVLVYLYRRYGKDINKQANRRTADIAGDTAVNNAIVESRPDNDDSIHDGFKNATEAETEAAQEILNELKNISLSDEEPASPDVVNSTCSFASTDYSISDDEVSMGFSPDTQSPTPLTMPAYPHGEFYEALNSPIIIPYEDIPFTSSEFRDSVSAGGFLPLTETLRQNPWVVEEYTAPVKKTHSGVKATDVNYSIQQICNSYSDITPKTLGLRKDQPSTSNVRYKESNSTRYPTEITSKASFDNVDASPDMPLSTQKSRDTTNSGSEKIFGYHPLGSLTPNQF
ncbi:hypothetical protein ScPMuIL_013929 [Solemya velum]